MYFHNPMKIRYHFCITADTALIKLLLRLRSVYMMFLSFKVVTVSDKVITASSLLVTVRIKDKDEPGTQF